MNDTPVFIGGLQRCGTSLMRAIVGSHPDIAIFQWDLPLWTEFYDRYKAAPLDTPEQRATLLNEILTHKKVLSANIELSFDAIMTSLADEADPTCGTVFAHILQEYAKQANRPRWGLKTPRNEFYTEAIFNEFPNAKFVHLLRDPRDVTVSYKSYGNGAWHYNILQHIYEWKRSANIAQRNQKKYASSYIVVRYEDLVSHPEETIREVCHYIEAEYSHKLLEMSGHPGWTGGNSFFDDIGKNPQGITGSAIGRYKQNLPSANLSLYQHLLQNEMTEWDYDNISVTLTHADRIRILTSLMGAGIDILITSILIPVVEKTRGTYFYERSKDIYKAVFARLT